MNDDETPKPKAVTKYKNLSSKVYGFLKQQDGWLGHGRSFSHYGESVGYGGIGLRKPAAKARDGELSSQPINFK